MKSDARLLKRLSLTGFLSFGPGTECIELEPLNVLIGPNGSGKSNLVEALSVLRAVSKDLPLPIREGGGVRDWLWADRSGSANTAVIDAVFAEGRVAQHPVDPPAVRYRLEFGHEADSFVVLDERIENEAARSGQPKPYFYFGYESGQPYLNEQGGGRRSLRRDSIDPTQSILSQRRDPDLYPELTALADVLRRVRIYRSWQFGPDSALRGSCRADVRNDYLSEDFDNLPSRLSVLKRDPAVKRRFLDALAEFAPGFEDVEIVPEGGRLQLYVTEHGCNLPAHRLSDGTLRVLCILAILLDPAPAPLVAIEEPELGLHPDQFAALADALVDASSRMQLVVTTHSTQLVDGLSEHAASVVICEKPGSTTTLTRLDQETVDRMRRDQGLGRLWMTGELGGTRW